jgi:hypothetical protein
MGQQLRSNAGQSFAASGRSAHIAAPITMIDCTIGSVPGVLNKPHSCFVHGLKCREHPVVGQLYAGHLIGELVISHSLGRFYETASRSVKSCVSLGVAGPDVQILF